MNQQRIWDYYQSERLDKFSSAGPRLRQLIRIADGLVGPGRLRILNIGIGDATLERMAISRGWSVHAVDPSRECVQRCSDFGVDARQGSIEALPFDSEYFDVVFSSEVFEHLSAEQMRKGLAEIVRALRPSGCLVGTVPFDEHLDDQRVMCPHCGEVFHRWGHQQRFTQADVERVLPDELQVRSIRVAVFVDWGVLNWKGKAIAAAKKTLAALGVHGTNEHIVFAAQKTSVLAR